MLGQRALPWIDDDERPGVELASAKGACLSLVAARGGQHRQETVAGMEGVDAPMIDREILPHLNAS